MPRSKKEESLVDLENELDPVENEEEVADPKEEEKVELEEISAQEEESKPKRRRQRRPRKVSLDSFTETESDGEAEIKMPVAAAMVSSDQTDALIKSIDGMTKQWQVTLQTLIQDPKRAERSDIRPPVINKIAIGLSVFSFLLSLISLSLSQSARQTAIHNDLAVHDRISQMESSFRSSHPAVPSKRR